MNYQEQIDQLNCELKTSDAPDDMLKDLLSMQLQHKRLGLLHAKLANLEEGSGDLKELLQEAQWRKELIEIGVEDSQAALDLGVKLETLKMLREMSAEHLDTLEAIIQTKLDALNDPGFIQLFRSSGEDALEQVYLKWAREDTETGRRLARLLSGETQG